VCMLVELDRQAEQRFSAEGLRWGGIFIISGYRSPATQAIVNPSNPASKHSRCPSVAADLRISDLPASTTPFELWGFLGGIWQALGGRWGGTFPTPDPNHFELAV